MTLEEDEADTNRAAAAVDELRDREVMEAAERRKARLEAKLIEQGYDLDALERDNPYNQWLYE